MFAVLCVCCVVCLPTVCVFCLPQTVRCVTGWPPEVPCYNTTRCRGWPWPPIGPPTSPASCPSDSVRDTQIRYVPDRFSTCRIDTVRAGQVPYVLSRFGTCWVDWDSVRAVWILIVRVWSWILNTVRVWSYTVRADHVSMLRDCHIYCTCRSYA